MIKWAQVLPHVGPPPFAGRGARPKPPRLPGQLASRPATRCKTGVAAPGFISRRAASPRAAPGRGEVSSSGTQRGFTSSKRTCSFLSPPFPFPLPVTRSSPLQGDDAHGMSPLRDRGQDRAPPVGLPGAPLPHVTPAAAPEELEIKAAGTGNFPLPLPAAAGDGEAAAGSFRESWCRVGGTNPGRPPRRRWDRPPHAPREMLGCEQWGAAPPRPPETTCQPQPGGSPHFQPSAGKRDGGEKSPRRRGKPTPALPAINKQISLHISGCQTPLRSGRRDAESQNRAAL